MQEDVILMLLISSEKGWNPSTLIWFTVSTSPRIKVKFTDAYEMCRSAMMCRVGLKPLAVSCHSLCQ